MIDILKLDKMIETLQNVEKQIDESSLQDCQETLHTLIPEQIRLYKMIKKLYSKGKSKGVF